VARKFAETQSSAKRITSASQSDELARKWLESGVSGEV
jgi:hypothetical protein